MTTTIRPELRRSRSRQELERCASNITLQPPKIWGKGVVRDIRTTIGTHWLQEMTNLNQKTIAVTLLIFITVLAPTFTFGVVYGKTTGNLFGPIETIIATSWVGIAYSLIGGMPLAIIGPSGTVLAFTRAMVQIADVVDVSFLTFNVWVSMWLFIFTLLAGIFDVSRGVLLATRFTDDVFALLIVSLFVMDSVGDPFSDVGLLRYFQYPHALHSEMEEKYADDYSHLETALLSTLLGFGTTLMIFWLRSIKFSRFCCSQAVRTSIHDFAVTVSVILCSAISMFLFPTIETEQLNIPSQIEPTYLCCDDTCKTFFPDQCPEQDTPARARPWLVSFTDLNGKKWVPCMAAGPAVLAFLLCYLGSGIIWHLLNDKRYKLNHGEAYSYDLILIGLFNFVNSIFGLPWLLTVTMPTVLHLNSLADKDTKGNFLTVQETRLTMLFSHIMVGMSLLVLNLLQLLPVPVLYGVLLFQGLSALPNIQFWQRFLMLFEQPSAYARTVYNRHMKKKRVHLYTAIQIFFFGLLFCVQNAKAISVFFPLVFLSCIPARIYILPRIFEGWELVVLDGQDDEIEEWLENRDEVERKELLDGRSSLIDFSDDKFYSEWEESDEEGKIDEGALKASDKYVARQDTEGSSDCEDSHSVKPLFEERGADSGDEIAFYKLQKLTDAEDDMTGWNKEGQNSSASNEKDDYIPTGQVEAVVVMKEAVHVKMVNFNFLAHTGASHNDCELCDDEVMIEVDVTPKTEVGADLLLLSIDEEMQRMEEGGCVGDEFEPSYNLDAHKKDRDSNGEDSASGLSTFLSTSSDSEDNSVTLSTNQHHRNGKETIYFAEGDVSSEKDDEDHDVPLSLIEAFAATEQAIQDIMNSLDDLDGP